MITIAKIVEVAADAVIKETKKIKKGKFCSDQLNNAFNEGRITVLTQFPDGLEFEQIHVPVTWTFGDEVKNPLENMKIAFTKAMIENAIYSMSDLLEDKLLESPLTFIKDYYYYVGPVVQVPGQPAYYFLLSSAFARG